MVTVVGEQLLGAVLLLQGSDALPHVQLQGGEPAVLEEEDVQGAAVLEVADPVSLADRDRLLGVPER